MPTDREQLSGRWVRASEHDTDEDEVYVRPQAPLAPSRVGRRGLELHTDGSFVETAPGPVDGPEAGPRGSWSLEGEDLVLEGGSASGARKLRISSASAERLAVRKR